MEDYHTVNSVHTDLEIGNGYGYFYNIHDIENDMPEQRVYIEPMDLYSDIESLQYDKYNNMCNLCCCVSVVYILYIFIF